MDIVIKSLVGLKTTIPAELSRLARLPRPVKFTALSLSLGLALFGALTMFFQRRRKRAQTNQKKLEAKKQQRQQQQIHYRHVPSNYSAPQSSNRSSTSSRRLRSPRTPRTPRQNGDISHRLLDNNDVADLIRMKELSVSINSIGAASTTSSSSTITHSGAVDTANMSSLDLCQLGMENLGMAVSFWEDAVMKLSYLDDYNNVLAIPDQDTANLQHKLENLLDLAYRMQDNYERLCEREVDHIALESALAVFREQQQVPDDDDSSDQESFVSATDMANLTDLELNRDILHHVPLYEAGMLELKHGNVPCRSIRPEMVKCLSDVEFLAKLHGIRLAFQCIFDKPDKKEWFRQMGRKLVSDMLLKADKDVDEFHLAYDKMMEYVGVDANWAQIEEELRGRGVRCMSFYDIVLDFILMDAFDDLANPPSTILTVVQNRWLSNGFKETALATAVWSVLKAKRSLLKFNDGFIAHFYCITEHTSPLLAWGFLGPDSDLKDMCNFFKDLVLGFISDLFSFSKVRFTTVEALAEDILEMARVKSEIAAEKLKVNSPDHTPVNVVMPSNGML